MPGSGGIVRHIRYSIYFTFPFRNFFVNSSFDSSLVDSLMLTFSESESCRFSFVAYVSYYLSFFSMLDVSSLFRQVFIPHYHRHHNLGQKFSLKNSAYLLLRLFPRFVSCIESGLFPRIFPRLRSRVLDHANMRRSFSKLLTKLIR